MIEAKRRIGYVEPLQQQHIICRGRESHCGSCGWASSSCNESVSDKKVCQQLLRQERQRNKSIVEMDIWVELPENEEAWQWLALQVNAELAQKKQRMVTLIPGM